MAIITIVKACIVRLLFAVHGILAIWRVADVKHDPSYWCLLVSLMGLVCETTLTLKLRHGEEWKWFCPSVLFYLGCVLPCMWILELENMEKRLVYRDTHGLANCSEINIFDKYESLVASNGVELPISFRSNDWVLAMQQLLLGLLIVGRWILPKGEITRDQLSQLLLVYIGIAADILEFSTEALKENQVKCNKILILMLMGVWSWSLLQFCFVLTAIKVRKTRVATTPVIATTGCHCCETEVWAIMMTLIMQDGPYLSTRMYLLVHYHIDSQMMVFFTCKNLLVVLLQMYRLIVLRVERHSRPKRSEPVTLMTVTGATRMKDKYERSNIMAAAARKNVIDMSSFMLVSKSEEKRRVLKSLENLRRDKYGNVHRTVDTD